MLREPLELCRTSLQNKRLFKFKDNVIKTAGLFYKITILLENI